MGQMSTKCARLRQWWSFRGPTSGGEADPWRTAVLCECWIVGARSPALGAAYLRRVQVGGCERCWFDAWHVSRRCVWWRRPWMLRECRDLVEVAVV